ncbi:MAG: AFG1 family ATPase [Gammaproteobacteria bacterium]|nr:AFG1 family ATPase [Gammaproteobacteria bacterium]
MSNLVLSRLNQAVASGNLVADSAQSQLAQCLDALYTRLVAPVAPLSMWQKLRGVKPETVKGLYIQGEVGRGKTLLCDWFIEAYRDELAIERQHFHRFMESIHNELRLLGNVADPLPKISQKWASSVKLLVLDEMQVNDITDAMLMAGLFECLFDAGVVLLTTSNLLPNQLYRNGLQRERFLPCIALFESQCEVHQLGDGDDYRRRALVQAGVSIVGDNAAIAEFAAQSFEGLSNVKPTPSSIELFNRTLACQGVSNQAIYFRFEQICKGQRAAKDYVELAMIYPTLILAPVSPMTDSELDPLRRFINLVDSLYDHGSKLVIGSTVPIDQLYQGERMAFEFQRCLSRLVEMQSEDYLHRSHRS